MRRNTTDEGNSVPQFARLVGHFMGLGAGDLAEAETKASGSRSGAHAFTLHAKSAATRIEQLSAALWQVACHGLDAHAALALAGVIETACGPRAVPSIAAQVLSAPSATRDIATLPRYAGVVSWGAIVVLACTTMCTYRMGNPCVDACATATRARSRSSTPVLLASGRRF